MDLEQLLRVVQSGDMSAVGPMSAVLVPELARRLRRHARSESDLEDLIQDTLEVVLAELPGLPEHPSLCGWVFTIARNRLNRHRADKRRQLDTSLGRAADLALPDRGPSSELRHREIVGILVEAVEQLDEPYRVVIQNDLDGGDPKELAARLGLTLSGWRTRRQRGIGQLSDRFDEIFEDSR